MSRCTLAELADIVGGKLEGKPETLILGVSPIAEAGPGQVALILDEHLETLPETCQASGLIVPERFPRLDWNMIRVPNPRLAMIQALSFFGPKEDPLKGIHPAAVVSQEACIGPNVSIGAGAFIGDGAVIGEDSRIYPNVYIGRATIGNQCTLHPGVSIYSGTAIGDRVTIHSGTVIGSDGFGYHRQGSEYLKIPQIGTVEIGDDVEIGACCTIDRATMGKTVIRNGTKLDNQVQVGHNSTIGERCCIIAQVGISGSVEIGNDCVLAGQVGIKDHVKLSDGVTVGAKSGVMHNLTPGEWIGVPALPAREGFRCYQLFTKLPELRQQVRDLERRCRELEQRLAGQRLDK